VTPQLRYHHYLITFTSTLRYLQVKGEYNKAVEDLNRAVELDPSNINYRQQRALLFRLTGDYLHAVNETLFHR
jgi:tetratricopeptide (TPR) repeat protein